MSAFGGQTPTLGLGAEEEKRRRFEKRTIGLSKAARETLISGRTDIGPVLEPDDSKMAQLLDLKDMQREAQELRDRPQLTPEQKRKRFERKTLGLSQIARETFLTGRTGIEVPRRVGGVLTGFKGSLKKAGL
jgi:hypothetical protein